MVITLTIKDEGCINDVYATGASELLSIINYTKLLKVSSVQINEVVPVIPNLEQREILLYAFRYALGRQTYAPHTIIEVLKTSWGSLSESDRSFYKKEIKEALGEHRAGSEFDSRAWEAILQL